MKGSNELKADFNERRQPTRFIINNRLIDGNKRHSQKSKPICEKWLHYYLSFKMMQLEDAVMSQAINALQEIWKK